VFACGPVSIALMWGTVSHHSFCFLLFFKSSLAGNLSVVQVEACASRMGCGGVRVHSDYEGLFAGDQGNGGGQAVNSKVISTHDGLKAPITKAPDSRNSVHTEVRNGHKAAGAECGTATTRGR